MLLHPFLFESACSTRGLFGRSFTRISIPTWSVVTVATRIHRVPVWLVRLPSEVVFPTACLSVLVSRGMFQSAPFLRYLLGRWLLSHLTLAIKIF